MSWKGPDRVALSLSQVFPETTRQEGEECLAFN